MNKERNNIDCAESSLQRSHTDHDTESNMPWRGCPRDVRKTSSGKRCELTSEDGIRILGMEQQVQSPGRKGSWGYRGPKGGLRGEAGVAGTGRQLWEEPGGENELLI